MRRLAFYKVGLVVALIGIVAWAADDTIVPTNSGKAYLKDNSGNLWPASVAFTTDGNSNVIPISSGGSGGTVTANQGLPGSSPWPVYVYPAPSASPIPVSATLTFGPTPLPVMFSTPVPVTGAFPTPIPFPDPLPVSFSTPVPVTGAFPTPAPTATNYALETGGNLATIAAELANPVPVTFSTPVPVTGVFPTPIPFPDPLPVSFSTPIPVTFSTPVAVTGAFPTPPPSQLVTFATPIPVTGAFPTPPPSQLVTFATPVPVTGAFPTPAPTPTNYALETGGNLATIASELSSPILVTFSTPVPVSQSTSPWVNNITQFGGTNLSTGTGVSGSGIPRVTMSSDSSFLSQNLLSSDALSGTGNLFSATNMLQYSGMSFVLYGTFSATITVSASNDGTNYFTIPAFSQTNLTVDGMTSLTNADLYFVPIAYNWLKIAVTSYASGTINFVGEQYTGFGRPKIIDTVIGNIASGNTDSGNGVKISGVYNTTVPSISNGQRSDLQTDSRGALQITPLDGLRATYSASAGFTPGTGATDVCTIYGSSTKTVRVIEIRTTAGESVAATTFNVSLIMRSAANSGGTSTTQTLAPHDSNDAAATATVRVYTANATTLGASIGNLAVERMEATTSGGNVAPTLIWHFGDKPGQGIVLRGTAQGLAINYGGTAPSSATCGFEWTEE